MKEQLLHTALILLLSLGFATLQKDLRVKRNHARSINIGDLKELRDALRKLEKVVEEEEITNILQQALDSDLEVSGIAQRNIIMDIIMHESIISNMAYHL